MACDALTYVLAAVGSISIRKSFSNNCFERMEKERNRVLEKLHAYKTKKRKLEKQLLQKKQH